MRIRSGILAPFIWAENVIFRKMTEGLKPQSTTVVSVAEVATDGLQTHYFLELVVLPCSLWPLAKMNLFHSSW